MKSPSTRKSPSPTAPMGSIAPYGLRMPGDLKGALEAAAQKNGRSLNSEIVARLEASIEGGEPTGGLKFLQAAKASASKGGEDEESLVARVSALEAAFVVLSATIANAPE